METVIKNPRGNATSRQGSQTQRRIGKPMFAALAVAAVAVIGWLGLRMSGGETTTSASDVQMPAAAPPAPMPAQIAGAKVFHVAVGGKATNDGSVAAPIDLATALSYDGPVAAGDTVWLHGGVYKGAFKSNLRGAEDAPILVRQFPGEHATIDSGTSDEPALTVDGGWTWYWGFEVMSSEPRRASPENAAPKRRVGVWSTASNVRFINLVIHDLAGGIHLEQGSSNVEMYGNVVYYNGWQGPEDPHGSAIEAQGANDALYLRENIVFRQMRNGIEVLNTSHAAIHLEGNVAFDNGTLSSHRQANLLVAGGFLRLVDNHTFFTAGGRGGTNIVGYNLGCTRLEARDNYWIHLGGYPLDLSRCDGNFSANVLAGIIHESLMASFAGNAYHSGQLPAGVKTFVRPNHYEPGRAHIVVHNWDRVAAVKVDLAKAGLASGAPYEIRNVQNYQAPAVASGVFDGHPIMLRLTGLQPAPVIGEVAAPPREVARDFGVFVVLPGKAAAAPKAAEQTNP